MVKRHGVPGRRRHQQAGTRISRALILTMLVLFCMSIVFPFYYILTISFNEGADSLKGGIFLWPRAPTLDNYKEAFQHPTLLNSMWITLSRTTIVTSVSLFLMSLLAYGLTFRNIPGRKTMVFYFYFTTLFGGGLIPTYILYRDLGILNTYLVLILPSLYSVWNMLIMRSFFAGIPEEMAESARIDGAREFRILVQLIYPVSLPVMVTVGLYVGVGAWNDWFTGQYFIMMKPHLTPAATLLNQLLSQTNHATSAVATDAGSSLAARGSEFYQQASKVTTESLRMAFVILIMVPIMCVYPFLQKHFVKGAMVGSLKG